MYHKPSRRMSATQLEHNAAKAAQFLALGHHYEHGTGGEEQSLERAETAFFRAKDLGSKSGREHLERIEALRTKLAGPVEFDRYTPLRFGGY